ncbi:MAG TPA: LysR substrate-binding domain-containing protein [Nocardioidaceae bacterium]|nr:LysR substrate-binding domain-containing protein [Nocardioidaceae bacterium]
METRRLAVLLELSRLGSMREVAEELGTTTSTVSQQIAALAREAGTPLVERDGRRVRLTPAGRRLAEHAVTILAAVDAARLDLDPHSEPAGTVRVAGFATAVRSSLVPVLHEMARAHPRVRLLIHEHEPAEAFALLRSDDVDLALTYDYDLAPADFDLTLESTPLWTTRWGLGVHADEVAVDGDAPRVFGAFADRDWIVNSRNTADADVVRTIASMAGFEPRVTHRVDSLDLVQELIAAGLGVGLLPADQPTRPDVVTLPLRDPEVRLRAYAVVRRGRSSWPPLALVLARIRATLGG